MGVSRKGLVVDPRGHVLLHLLRMLGSVQLLLLLLVLLLLLLQLLGLLLSLLLLLAGLLLALLLVLLEDGLLQAGVALRGARLLALSSLLRGEGVGLGSEAVGQQRRLGVRGELRGGWEDGLAVLHGVDGVGLLGRVKVGVGCAAAHWWSQQAPHMAWRGTWLGTGEAGGRLPAGRHEGWSVRREAAL